MNLKTVKNRGFTLAEILITLGIIGVVAAMTIPALLTNIQKREYLSRLTKTAAEINQAFMMSYNDLGSPDTETMFNMGRKEYFKTYWLPYIKNIENCESANECGYASNTPFIFLNGNKADYSVINNTVLTAFKLPSGAIVTIQTGDRKNGSGNEYEAGRLTGLVRIDINGGRLPNQFGKDYFLFRINEEGNGILPECSSYTDVNIENDCSQSGKGRCCAEKIKRAGWKIDSSYPW